jgi:hypothetical protein
MCSFQDAFNDDLALRRPSRKSQPARPDTTEAQEFLKKRGISFFERYEDGYLVVSDLRIDNLGLTKLPDLTCVIVGGDFSCVGNRLTNLIGGPKKVKGAYLCLNNNLTDLTGAPEEVGHAFQCDNNNLESLKNSPSRVGGAFTCGNNRLASLEHGPKFVGGGYDCSHNYLTDLVGAPERVGASFICSNNRLKTLKGAPLTAAKFKGMEFDCSNNPLLQSLLCVSQTDCKVISDLGTFENSKSIPQKFLRDFEAEAELLRTLGVVKQDVRLSGRVIIKPRPPKPSH